MTRLNEIILANWLQSAVIDYFRIIKSTLQQHLVISKIYNYYN